MLEARASVWCIGVNNVMIVHFEATVKEGMHTVDCRGEIRALVFMSLFEVLLTICTYSILVRAGSMHAYAFVLSRRVIVGHKTERVCACRSDNSPILLKIGRTSVITLPMATALYTYSSPPPARTGI